MAPPVTIALVLGTRPEAVKLLPVIDALRRDPRFRPRIVTTGQHREMVSEIFGPFAVVPDVDLEIMEPGQSPSGIVARALERLDRLFTQEPPGLVMVQGDTSSAFAAALAAFHRRVPVAHLEAGLRSFDRDHPFPEEANRRLVSVIADLHLAPTPQAAANLRNEGIAAAQIFVTGNTVVDTLLMALRRGHPGAAPTEGETGPYVLVTLHRREAWGGRDGEAPLEAMLGAIRAAADERPGLMFVYPVHYNPRVREPATRILGGARNVRLVDPLPYLPFVERMAGAVAILTDSGGIQEEAPSLGVPVLVLRRTTERPEAVAAGLSRLVGTAPERIRAELDALLARPRRPRPLPQPNPFGDGRAGERVRLALAHVLFHQEPRPDDFCPERPGETSWPSPS